LGTGHVDVIQILNASRVDDPGAVVDHIGALTKAQHGTPIAKVSVNDFTGIAEALQWLDVERGLHDAPNLAAIGSDAPKFGTVYESVDERGTEPTGCTADDCQFHCISSKRDKLAAEAARHDESS
jgi:hypothetical protein